MRLPGHKQSPAAHSFRAGATPTRARRQTGALARFLHAAIAAQACRLTSTLTRHARDDAFQTRVGGVASTRTRALQLATVATVGVAAALLVACGSSGVGLIPSASAGPLKSDFEAVAQAAESGNGNCLATETALGKTQQDFLALPASVDAGLRKRLREGVENLRKVALAMCAQPSATNTTTAPQQTTTSPSTTPATPTTSTPTNTATTPTPPPTTPPANNGGGTPAPEPESEEAPGKGKGEGDGKGEGKSENDASGGASAGGASPEGGR